MKIKTKDILFYIFNFITVFFVGFSLVHYTGYDTEGVYKSFTPIKWYFIAFAVSVILSAVLDYLQYKIKYYEKFFILIKNNCKSILNIVVCFVFSAVISAGIEFLLAKYIFGKMSTGNLFNVYRYIFIIACVFILLYLVISVIKKTAKIENLFAVIAVFAGAVMILSAPFGHIVWDTDSHYKFAVSQSNLYGLVTLSDYNVIYLEPGYLLGEPEDRNARLYENSEISYNESDKTVYSTVERGVHIAHVPASVAIAICRLFKTSFVTKVNCVKFVNLLLYTLICYLAIRKLKSGKTIMFTIALFPTNLFLAANIAYDWWVTALTMLGMSYFLSEMQQPEKEIKAWESAVMCGSFVLACLPKQIYFPILLIPFLLKKNYFKIDKKSKKIHYTICSLAIAALILSLGLRFISELNTGGDMRGGETVNVSGQIGFILSSPLKYTKILLKFIAEYLSFEKVQDYTVHFAYLGIGKYYIVLIVLLICAVITDKNEYDAYSSSVLYKAIFAFIFFSSVCLILTSLYISFTPVGLDTINGCQERYLIPLLVTFLPVIGSCKISNTINRVYYETGFAAVSASVLLYNIYYAMIIYMC